MGSSRAPLLPLLLLLLLVVALLPSPSRSASLYFGTASSSNDSALASAFLDSSPDLAPEPTFLEEVIDAVSERYGWDPDAEVRVWPLDADAARVGAVQHYQFRARVGSSSALVRLSDEAVEWRRPAQPAVEEVDGPDGLDVIAGNGAVGFGPGVRDVDLVGPVEVRVTGGAVELQLPSWNATYTGLTKVFVAAGITLKIIGAQKVSFSHPHSIGHLANGSLFTSNSDLSQILPLSHSTCAPLLQVSLVGSVVIVAHETDVSGGHVKPFLRSHDTMELLSDKCQANTSDRLISSSVFFSISPRLTMLESNLKAWFGKKNQGNGSINFIEAKVTPIPLVKFRLELERDITEVDGIWENISEWKTKPAVQQVTLDIIARVEEEGRLKAMSVRKVRKPFSIADATSWSSLTSNISFTKFMSFVLPPEPLSLDVEW